MTEEIASKSYIYQTMKDCIKYSIDNIMKLLFWVIGLILKCITAFHKLINNCINNDIVSVGIICILLIGVSIYQWKITLLILSPIFLGYPAILILKCI